MAISQEFIVDGVALTLSGADEVDNTGAKRVWDAAVVLAGFFEKDSKGRKMVKGKNVLELGAGLGYLSLAVGVLGAKVVTTEMDEMLPVLQRNITKGVGRVAGEGRVAPKISVKPLDWTQHTTHLPPILDGQPPFDLIIATDVIYIEDYVLPFLETISAVLSHSPKAHIYIGVHVRDEALTTAFAKRMSSEINVVTKLIPRKKLPHPFNTEEWEHAYIIHAKRASR